MIWECLGLICRKEEKFLVMEFYWLGLAFLSIHYYSCPVLKMILIHPDL